VAVSLSPETLKAFVDLALSGSDEEHIAVSLRLSRITVRQTAEALGLRLSASAREWCDRCARPVTVIDRRTGWCQPCTIEAKEESQRIADAEEEERLRKAERDINALKTERKRMRERYDTNPRKGRGPRESGSL
jgi:hypothetical protein